MKRKFLSVLLILVLACSFSLVTAVPAGAAPVTQTVTGDGAGGFTLAEMDQQFSTATVDASAGDTVLFGSVALGNFDAGNGNDVWYEAGLVSDETYLGYSGLYNKGVYMIALQTTGYYKVHVQNVAGQTPDNVGVDNYLGNSDPYPDLGWGDAGLSYFKVPEAAFDYELRYHDVTTTGGKVDLRISTDGETWSGWKLYQYAEDDMESFYGWAHEDAVASGYAGDDDLTDARIVSQIFVCSTTTATFTADYDNITVNDTPYVLAPRVLNTNTDKGYTAIQLAIDAPETDTGHTISVAAGTYNENIVIDKTLTLEGANAGIPATGARGPESIINAQGVPIAVLINGAGTVATFDGFTVDNYDTVGILGGAFRDTLQEVPLGDDPVAVHILNNIIMPPTVAPPHNNNIQVGAGTTGTIIGNEVSGALLESPDWSGSGILVAASSNVLISNNYVHNSEGGIQTVGYAEYRDGVPAESNLIENNLVENCDAGISVQGNSIGTIIRHNDVLNNNDVGIESMAYDISWDHSTPSGTEVHYNNIDGNEYGVKSIVYWNDTGTVFAEEVDAAFNWWGTTDGSAIAPMTSGEVDYSPWWGASYLTGTAPDIELVDHPWTWYTNDSIQSAINSATEGDTINVAAGTYNEQVTIDGSLTLLGAKAGQDARTRDTTSGESIIDGGTSTAITISADGVIVDGFTLDGGITLDDAVNLISGGTISNNIITGADETGGIKAQNGIRLGWDYGLGVKGFTIENNIISLSLEKGIRFANTKLGDGGPQHISNITISGNEIKDNGSAGVETYGPGPNTIINNIISGNDGNGLNLKFGSGDIVTGNIITNNPGGCGITLRQAIDTTVENNTVSGHISQDEVPSALGIIGGKGSGIHIFDTSEGNTIRFNDISGNNYGVFIHSKGDLQPSGNSITYNKIEDNINYGILNALVGPPAPVAATNNWWGTTTDTEVAAMVSVNVAYDPWHLKQITDLAVSNPTESSVDLFWTTTGAWDGDYFDVRYSTSAITVDNWSSAKRVTGEPTPATTVQGMKVHKLSGNTIYHFGLKLIDKGIGSSDISNIVSATTLTTAPTDTTPPSWITDLEAATGTPPTKKVILSWTAKGDDETDGIASKYIIKRSTSEITAANFDSATTVHNNLRCKSNGESIAFTVKRLTANTTYYFAIKIQDEVPNTSDISNVVDITTASLLTTVTNISPPTADNGVARILTITGTNFTSSGTTVVRLISDDNAFRLPNVTYVSATQLTAVVPIGAPTGTYKAKIINNHGRSALSSATYIVTAAPTPLPVVTNLIPQMAASDTVVNGVKIFGKNLTGATAVKFGDTPAISFTVFSDTKITADVPGLTVGEYDVKVTTPAGTNSISAVKFKVSAPVVFSTDTTEDTTTSEVIDLGDTNEIPVQITLTTDTSETATQDTDTDAEIEVVIPPQTKVTDSEGNDYTGNIHPPRVVKPDESVLTDLADNAVVIEMGNPEKTIHFDQDFVATIIITSDTEPVIWYYNKDTEAYELAGKTGTKDGIDYVPGGTKLNQENNTYIMGLLLDHMSPYIAGVIPHITSAPATATADVAFTISGTNFHPTGANVYLNGTAGTIISRTSTTQIVVTFPATGSYTLKVENPDELSDTTSITLTTPTTPPAVGGGGGIRWPPEGTTDVRGEVSSEGVFEELVTAFSEDELCTLTIPEDTVGLTEDLEPLDEITILREDEPPEPPEEADIVLAYDLGPDGATFDPAITLTFSYDPADIPEGKDVLVVAYYDEVGEAWVSLEGEVDTVTKTITVSISHFTTFAIIASAPPPPPPAPAPAAFSVSSLSIEPTEARPEEAVTITLSVANTGGTEGRYTVVLKINGVKEAEKRVTVAAGETQEVSFTVAKEATGTYIVNVDELSGTFTVALLPPPPIAPVPEVIPPFNWPLVGGCIAALVVIAIICLLVIRRGRVA